MTLRKIQERLLSLTEKALIDSGHPKLSGYNLCFMQISKGNHHAEKNNDTHLLRPDILRLSKIKDDDSCNMKWLEDS